MQALGNGGPSTARRGVVVKKHVVCTLLLLVTLSATSTLIRWNDVRATVGGRLTHVLGRASSTTTGGPQNSNHGNPTKTVNAVDGDGNNGTGGSVEGRDKEENGSTPSGSSKSNRAGAGSTPLSRSRRIEFEKKYAALQILDGGKVECQIHTSPVSVEPLPDVEGEASPSLWLNYSYSGNASNAKGGLSPASMPEEEPPQYMIHIHGLMHTGTGYLRATIYKALANSRYFVERSRRDGRPTVASVQKANWPCRREKFQFRSSDKRKKACWVPEDEGCHLQTVYPEKFALKETKARSSGMSPDDERTYLSQLGHLSSLCSLTNDNAKEEDATAEEGEDGTAKRIGTTLFRQWLPFWEDPSATFLLQKTPMLEALFHERVKVLPAFHVIIVRHPWASNSWRRLYPTHVLDYNIMWAKSFEHVFETLHQGMIKWYAVITYEALVMYQDVVVDELMEIVKSGMRRYGNDRSAENGSRRLLDRSGRREMDLPLEGQADRMHRQLPIREGKDPTTYLKPYMAEVKLWRQCNQNKQCSKELRLLTKRVFSFFGFASIAQVDEESVDPPSTSPLSTSPGTVGVTREFGRVLYTSEAEALRKFRKDLRGQGGRTEEEEDRTLDYAPPPELISNLKDIFREI